MKLHKETAIAGLALAVDGQPLLLDAHGRATYVPATAGHFAIVATASDADGTKGCCPASEDVTGSLGPASLLGPIATATGLAVVPVAASCGFGRSSTTENRARSTGRSSGGSGCRSWGESLRVSNAAPMIAWPKSGRRRALPLGRSLTVL